MGAQGLGVAVGGGERTQLKGWRAGGRRLRRHRRLRRSADFPSADLRPGRGGAGGGGRVHLHPVGSGDLHRARACGFRGAELRSGPR